MSKLFEEVYDPELEAKTKAERAVARWEKRSAIPLAILAIVYLALWFCPCSEPSECSA